MHTGSLLTHTSRRKPEHPVENIYTGCASCGVVCGNPCVWWLPWSHIMRILCEYYAHIMRILCAYYAHTMRILCAYYAHIMRICAYACSPPTSVWWLPIKCVVTTLDASDAIVWWLPLMLCWLLGGNWMLSRSLHPFIPEQTAPCWKYFHQGVENIFNRMLKIFSTGCWKYFQQGSPLIWDSLTPLS